MFKNVHFSNKYFVKINNHELTKILRFYNQNIVFI